MLKFVNKSKNICLNLNIKNLITQLILILHPNLNNIEKCINLVLILWLLLF